MMALERLPGGRRFTKKRLKARSGPLVREGMECQTITLLKGRYVQRYARCGTGCSVCSREGVNFEAARPGHGPYWYFETVVNGKRVRAYRGSGAMPRGHGEIPLGIEMPGEEGPKNAA